MKSEFKPDWISPPGDTIADILKTRKMTPRELGRSLGIRNIKQLINGKAKIDDRVAKRLAEVLGGTEDFWNKREFNYRKSLSRQKK